MSTNDDYPRCPDFQKAVKEASVDESLFSQIVECFSSRLTDFAIYYCRDDSLGKDAFQDAMIAALTSLDTYRGDAPIEPWLKRIVVSSCSRLRRGRKNSPAYNVNMDGRDTSSVYADDAPDQELKLMMLQGLEQIRGEIDKLNEPNRSLLIAHDVEEEPITVLAARFEMTQDSVKSRLKRARSQVRDKIIETMIED